MKEHQGNAVSWGATDGVLELQLHRAPCNEIGTTTLAELEAFVGVLQSSVDEVHALVVHSTLAAGFCAGADLRELYAGMQEATPDAHVTGVRRFLERIHAVMNAIDAWPNPTIAAVHGICFGGGLELALVCDVIVADRMARFCFPELRLGLIPGFGGIPRLKRDVGNAVVRDLLLTGRSLNATRAHGVGLVGQLAGEGAALRVARSLAQQTAKFDRATSRAAKAFIKPIPHAELQREIDLFCELLARPAVEAGLRKFLTSTEVQPYLP